MNRAPAPEDLSPTEEVVEQNSGAAEFASRRGRETGAIISYRAVSRTPMGVCPTALQVVDRTRSVSDGNDTNWENHLPDFVKYSSIYRKFA
ncbi:hypothetical protein OPV22_002142 [Ensete ventricosum]|uniref:Uncharacterized protein n=1 Tax=Ensete ventricosum TaxID=4639 RepID=A0AAV8RX32_ENSVE|nr:hypothetical protein OPV22_002142 [Ensete ventricosum]